MICLTFLRPVRLTIAAFACALLFFSSVFPALASSPKSDPTQGVVQLEGIEQKTGAVGGSAPRGMEKIQENTKDGGLNGVQGSADKNKMSNPSNSQDATSFEEMLKNTLRGE